MSDDNIELDDDELAELYEEDPDMLTPEDVFKMVLLNKRNKKRVWVQLEDSEGDEVELADMMSELINYVKDKLSSEEGNQLVDQIMPLMTQSVVSGLGRLAGIQSASFILANPTVRMAIIYMMVVSFILYKMVQVKGLTIHTLEEDVTEEEIEEIERKSRASSVANMSAMMGMNPVEVLEEMVKRGNITEEDLIDLIGKVEKKDGEDNS